jgi:hypothetical protein
MIQFRTKVPGWDISRYPKLPEYAHADDKRRLPVYWDAFYELPFTGAYINRKRAYKSTMYQCGNCAHVFTVTRVLMWGKWHIQEPKRCPWCICAFGEHIYDDEKVWPDEYHG